MCVCVCVCVCVRACVHADCDQCEDYFLVYCEYHGPPLFRTGALNIPLGTPDRAKKTLPLGLEVNLYIFSTVSGAN